MSKLSWDDLIIQPIAANDATLEFALAGGKLEIDLTKSEFAGGALKGSLGAVMGDGQADLTLRAGVQGAALQSLVWDRLGLPTASGTLDVSFEAVGRGRSTAGILATLSGSGSFSIADGRLNALNADALAAVMAAAEGETDPDDDAARETFTSLFGSGALAFGRATGSFSIANGAVNIPTVSLAADNAKVLADAMIDLNTLTLQSKWTVRMEEGGAEEAQPYVPIVFRGAIMRPAREIDLDPLLNLLRSRFLQRQVEELEELKRRQEEAERQAAEEEAARQAAEEEAARQPAAETELTTGATVGGSDAEPPADAAAEPPAGPPPPVELVPVQPAPEPSAVTGDPATAPPPPPQQTQPSPSAPSRQTQAPASAPPPTPVEQRPLFRTLPNGVVIKIR